MAMTRFTRPFRRLRWKLTLSYTLTSVVTFLIIELIVLGIAFGFVSLNIPALILNTLKQQAPQAAPYFVHGSPDREALTSWLRLTNATVLSQGPFSRFRPPFLMVADARGQPVASIGSVAGGSVPVPAGTP